MWFGPIPRMNPHCLLELWLYQIEMSNGYIGLVIESAHNVSTFSIKAGNNFSRYVFEEIFVLR